MGLVYPQYIYLFFFKQECKCAERDNAIKGITDAKKQSYSYK
jgi:hypothetical protein